LLLSIWASSNFDLSGLLDANGLQENDDAKWSAHNLEHRMTKADEFRKRAQHISKRLGHRVQTKTPLGRKQKVLTDMAANEDWLDGTILPKPKSPAK
jgi:hypothetical protein